MAKRKGFFMKKERFEYPSKDGKTVIHGIRWIPEGPVRGILQIIHGMEEHIGRYEEFACFLAKKGYLVTGHDQLGHGDSVRTEADRGYFASQGGGEILVEDIHTLRQITEKICPGVKYFMLGHSMGSFLLRRYLTVHGQGLSGAVIMGTGAQPEGALKAGRVLCRLLAGIFHWHHRSRLITALAFGKNYRRFAGLKDGTTWLSKNAENIKAYKESPKCGFLFTLNGYDVLFEIIQYIQEEENLRKTPKNIPLFFVSGKDDPVGNFGKGVRQVYRRYKEAGVSDIKGKLYPNDRHEILNELDRSQVYQDIQDWLDSH